MEKKQRFFIYDRKEVGILVLLGVMVAVFAFTLGVHLGKRVGVRIAGHGASESVTAVGTAPITSPEEQIRNEPVPTPSSVNGQAIAQQALQQEVARTGIKLDQPRQVNLPEKTVSESEGVSILSVTPDAKPTSARTITRVAPADDEAPVEAPKAAPNGHRRFTLQVGSYADLSEAKARARDLEISGLKATVRAAQVKGKGRRYHILVGTYANAVEAIRAGRRYRAQGVIGAFVVARATASR